MGKVGGTRAVVSAKMRDARESQSVAWTVARSLARCAGRCLRPSLSAFLVPICPQWARLGHRSLHWRNLAAGMALTSSHTVPARSLLSSFPRLPLGRPEPCGTFRPRVVFHFGPTGTRRASYPLRLPLSTGSSLSSCYRSASYAFNIEKKNLKMRSLWVSLWKRAEGRSSSRSSSLRLRSL